MNHQTVPDKEEISSMQCQNDSEALKLAKVLDNHVLNGEFCRILEQYFKYYYLLFYLFPLFL